MAGKVRKVPLRWDAAKEKRFLEKLAATSNVTASLKACGMSMTSLYTRRRAKPAFRLAWDGALDEGYARLEASLLDEAINGVIRTVMRDGREVTERGPPSERTRLALLAAHAKKVGAIRAEPAAAAATGMSAAARATAERKFAKLIKALEQKS